MIIIFISKILFIIGILGVLVIVVRKFPDLSRTSKIWEGEKFSFKKSINKYRNSFHCFLSGKFFQQSIVGNLEKSFRKFKILSLKVSNGLDKLIKKLKKKT